MYGFDGSTGQRSCRTEAQLLKTAIVILRRNRTRARLNSSEVTAEDEFTCRLGRTFPTGGRRSGRRR